MAATYSFTKSNGLIKIVSSGTVNGNALTQFPTVLQPIERLNSIAKLTSSTIRVDLIGTDDYLIYPAVDTVTIGLTTYAPASKTVDEMIDIMEASDVFYPL